MVELLQSPTASSIVIHVISLKRESGRFSFHSREVLQKCIESIGKL